MELYTLGCKEQESYKPEKSGEQFRLIFEQAPIGMLITTLKGQFLQVNHSMADLLGYSVDELLTMSFPEVTHPEDVEKDLFLVRDLLQGAKPRLIMEKRFLRSDGDIIHVVLHGALIRDHRSRPRSFIGQVVDITERKNYEQTMRHMAYHDQLTGLPNRILFRDKFFLALTQAKINKGMLAVVFLDIDRFKTINDTLGHLMGDQALKIIADRLARSVRATDLVARLGGDEFAVVLPTLSQEQDLLKVLDKMISTLEEPLRLKDMGFLVSASIGAAIYPRDGQDIDTLLQVADTAMYNSKNQKGLGT